jgi:hypothetical protein
LREALSDQQSVKDCWLFDCWTVSLLGRTGKLLAVSPPGRVNRRDPLDRALGTRNPRLVVNRGQRPLLPQKSRLQAAPTRCFCRAVSRADPLRWLCGSCG